MLILPGLSPIIGSTEAEAQRLARELNDLSDPEVGRKRLSGRFGGHDFSHLPLDKPLSPEDFPDPGAVQAARSRTEVIVGLVRREKPTLRQLLAYLAGARGHFVTTGTPEQIADLMEDWFPDGAADGFNLMPPVLPPMLDLFVERGRAAAAAARPVPHRIPGRDAARPLWPAAAGCACSERPLERKTQPMIDVIELYRLRVPLTVPYKVSKRTFHAFAPLVAMVRTRDGRVGWGEASISPGYGSETPDGGWELLKAWSERLAGQTLVRCA